MNQGLESGIKQWARFVQAAEVPRLSEQFVVKDDCRPHKRSLIEITLSGESSTEFVLSSSQPDANDLLARSSATISAAATRAWSALSGEKLMAPTRA